MSEPSPKMKKVLKYIETDLNIKFEGDRKSFDDVHKFIDDHIEEWKQFKDTQPPSEGQLKGLKLIEESLGIKYDGPQGRKEISEFLSENLEDAMKAKETKGPKKAPKKKEEKDPFDDD